MEILPLLLLSLTCALPIFYYTKGGPLSFKRSDYAAVLFELPFLARFGVTKRWTKVNAGTFVFLMGTVTSYWIIFCVLPREYRLPAFAVKEIALPLILGIVTLPALFRKILK